MRNQKNEEIKSVIANVNEQLIIIKVNEYSFTFAPKIKNINKNNIISKFTNCSFLSDKNKFP